MTTTAFLLATVLCFGFATDGFSQTSSNANHRSTDAGQETAPTADAKNVARDASSPQESSPHRRRRHTQKEIRARLKADERQRAVRILEKLETYQEIASDRHEKTARRRSAIELLGHSRDLRAARTLLKMMDDPDRVVGHAAIVGLRTMSRALNDDPQRNGDLKKLVGPKAVSMAKEDPNDLDRAEEVVGLLISLNENAHSVQLAEKLMAKGRYSVVNEFWYWDESVEPPIFRIKASARRLFVDATAENVPDEARVNAASLLSRAGDKEYAFPVLKDVLLNGKDLAQRQKAMDELRDIGDEPSRQAVREAAEIPALARSAKFVLKLWDKRSPE